MYANYIPGLYKSLPFIPLTMGAWEEQEVVDRRKKGLGSHQFIWVTKGSGLFTVGSEKKILSAGDGLFTKASTQHSYKAAEKTFSTMWVTFTNGESLLDYYGIGDFLFFKAPDSLSDDTDLLISACRATESVPMCSTLCMDWTVRLLDSVFKKRTSKIALINNFIEKNIQSQLTITDISKGTGVTEFYLTRKYPLATGMTVMQTLKEYRINRAKTLLEFSSTSIKMIASLCGFADLSYFIKTFRAATGKTPLSYRKTEK